MMKLSILHRVLFTLMLSAIMSGSMTYMISSFYCEPDINMLANIWIKAWAKAFTVIFLLSPLLHTLSARITITIKK